MLEPGRGKTISWSTWRYVNSSNSCWPYDQNCQRNPRASCTIPRCEVSWGGWCHHKNFLLLVVGPCYSACKLFVWPSKLMQSNLPWSSPLSPLFIFSCFGPKSWGMSFLLGHTIPHEFILHLSKSLNSLRDGKKLSINILCPKPPTLQVTCLTVACVAVMLSSGRVWVCTQLYSHVIYIPWFITECKLPHPLPSAPRGYRIVVHILCQVSVNCLQNAENAVCVKICLMS